VLGFSGQRDGQIVVCTVEEVIDGLAREAFDGYADTSTHALICDAGLIEVEAVDGVAHWRINDTPSTREQVISVLEQELHSFARAFDDHDGSTPD